MGTPQKKNKAGLILTGGGARAAYQVGVLKAVRELLPSAEHNPFPILCGTSMGAINAATLAAWADDFGLAVAKLLEFWENLRVDQVYRSDLASMARMTVRGLLRMSFLAGRSGAASLLDNSPLGETLARHLDFARVQENIDTGSLYAISLTCSGYSSGQSVSFYQGGPDVRAWQREQRIGSAMPLRLELLMASAALPLIFPAVKINREFFGDGSLCQTAPISPALHLGAERVLVIGTGRPSNDAPRVRSRRYPSVAQIAGQALNRICFDSLHSDIGRLQCINQMLSFIPSDNIDRSGLHWRPVRVLAIWPSESIDRIAARFVTELPGTVRFLLRRIGALNRDGANLASYVLFERGFCRALIELGYRDTQQRRAEVLEFLRGEPGSG